MPVPIQSTAVPSAHKLTTIFTQRRRQSLLTAAILLALIPTVADVSKRITSTSMDLCYINREIEKPPPPLIPIRDGALHDLSVLSMWVAMFMLCLLPNQRTLAFFRLIYASLWFHSTYILLSALKSLLADYNCAGRHKLFPNGISGHYCYFIFVSLTSASLGRERLRSHRRIDRQNIERLAQFPLFLFFVGAISTLYRTYFHGYHSPRQISLGMALGIISFVSLDYVLFPTHGNNSLALMVSTLFAVSLTSIALYFRWWPHEEAGPAISRQQLLFHSTLWFLLVLTLSLLSKPAKKDS